MYERDRAFPNSIGAPLARSLSVVLPVHNAQSTVAAVVEGLLEVLPELTGDFEVVVVDDGSADATIEVVDDLAACYPQVRAFRHATQEGRVAAVCTAMRRSRGEILLVKDQHCPLAADQIPRLWRAIKRHEFVLGCVRSSPGVRWPGWRRDPGTAQNGFQMARRRAMEPVVECLDDLATLRAALSDRGLSWCEIEVRQREGGAVEQASQAERTGAPSAGPRGLKRPNYLAKVRDFALGE